MIEGSKAVFTINESVQAIFKEEPIISKDNIDIAKFANIYPEYAYIYIYMYIVFWFVI